PPGIYPFDPEMGYPERAERQIKLLRAGVLGEPNGTPKVDPEVEDILFDVIARSAHTDAVDRPVTIQWRFEDADPHYVRIDNGSTRHPAGRDPDPAATPRTTSATRSHGPDICQHAREAALERPAATRGTAPP